MKKIFYRLCVLCIVCAAENGHSGLLEKDIKEAEIRVKSSYGELKRKLFLELSFQPKFQDNGHASLSQLIEYKRILEDRGKELLEKKVELQREIMHWDDIWTEAYENYDAQFEECDKKDREVRDVYDSMKFVVNGDAARKMSLWRQLNQDRRAIKDRQCHIVGHLEDSIECARQSLEGYENDLREIMDLCWLYYEKIAPTNLKIEFLEGSNGGRKEEGPKVEGQSPINTTTTELAKEFEIKESYLFFLKEREREETGLSATGIASSAATAGVYSYDETVKKDEVEEFWARKRFSFFTKAEQN